MMISRICRRRCVLPLLLPVLLTAAFFPARAGEPARGVRSLGEVCRDIAESGPEMIEGVWRLTAPGNDGVLIAIERESPGDYVITVVEAPDRSLIPGTLIGRASRGSERGLYDSWMYTSSPISMLRGLRRRDFTLKLSDDGNRLTFRKHRSPLAVNLYMSIPYLFIRPSIRNERFVESTPQGAERVYPVPLPPIEPIYL
ncbi:MAG: hypothetical protein HFJ93_00445 [Muribaculaceae bacterium]|nr:hypothetical protein [Muribaculaceae bacterium]